MSNEHLSQVGHSAVDQASNGDGYEDDDGPLDPSVFFGLFDDLTADADPEPVPNAEPATDSEVSDQPENDEHDTDLIEIVDVTTEPDTHPESASDSEPAETRQTTVSWWPTEPEKQSPADPQISVASPPPIPHVPDTTETPAPDPLDHSTRTPDSDPVDDEPPPDVGFVPSAVESAGNGAGPQALRFTAPAPNETREVGDDGDEGNAAAAAAELDRRIDELIDRRPVPEVPGDPGGGTMAKAALITIAIGLFGGLIVAFVLSLRSPDGALGGSVANGSEVGDPASSTVIDEPPAGLAGTIATGTRPTAELLAEEFANALPTALTGRLDLTSLRFEPGTTDLDERSATVVADIGRLLADQPAVPVTVSVRTYTEPTPAANLTLSIAQGDALAASLVTAGAVPDQIRARGIGAAPLSQAQPVPNFVALTPRFGDRRLDETLDGHSPFAFGVPTAATDGAWQLRPDGLLAIGGPAETLSAFPDAEVGAAGYSFLPPSETAVRSEADTAVSELGEFLVAAYGVDPEQITTIIPGSAVFVPTSEHGNHIWLQIGPASQGAFDVASIDPADITFEPGSAELDTVGLATVQALADILTSGGATIVVDVRSYETGDAAADLAQSEARRDALAEALITAGVTPQQLRMYASGASSYFLDDGGSTITITVAP